MPSIENILSWFCNSIQSICLAFGVLGFIIAFVIHRKKISHKYLGSLMMVGLTASIIPVGILMLICAFNTKYITYLATMQPYLGLFGLSVIFISIVEMRKWLQSKPE